ncbi:MAG TPA: hypothetical protein DEP35_06875 [Deltaproteobacteria bacterium]|nr:hypothetical protein [Deltaproteobacteria bacterium]
MGSAPARELLGMAAAAGLRTDKGGRLGRGQRTGFGLLAGAGARRPRRECHDQKRRSAHVADVTPRPDSPETRAAGSRASLAERTRPRKPETHGMAGGSHHSAKCPGCEVAADQAKWSSLCQTSAERESVLSAARGDNLSGGPRTHLAEGPAQGPGQQSVVFDRAADRYDATRGFPPGVAEQVAALVHEAAALNARAHLLEIGVGTGRLALPLAARGLRITGVDLSRRMMERLLAKCGSLRVDAVRADATQLPFASASFDAVLGVHVFHLIPRWRDVLREIARVLHPRGLLVHGGDDRASHWAQWRDCFGQDHALQNVGVPYDEIENFPEQEGWQLVGAARHLAFSRHLEPRRLVEQLLRRDWSWTWALSDAQLNEAAESLRAALTRRFGKLDSRTELQSGFWVRAYRRPT